MGTIKDLVDLVTQLANSVQDRKIASELNAIQSLILKLQAEQATLHEANVELREERLSLKEQIQQLKKSNPENKEKPSGVKWGCYQFAGDDGLYCTACYDTKGQKNRTTRATSKFRMCPVCEAVFGS